MLQWLNDGIQHSVRVLACYCHAVTVQSRLDPWEGAFLQNMIRARRRAAWSQAELAHHLREGGGLPFHQQTVQRIEKGLRPLRLSEAVVIVKILKMGDLTTAISPDTADGAQSALRTSVRIAQREQTRLKQQLRQLSHSIRDSHHWLHLELKSYTRTSQSTGQFDSDLRQAAENLLDRWIAYQAALRSLVVTDE